jgi:CRISPR/Cas system-associated protein Cas7 (RAMP superfamily)
MNRYKIYGTVSVDVYAEIDAPTLEDALEYANDNFEIVEYCNGSVGCEDMSYEFGDAEVTCCCDIDWCEDCSELVEEDVETETDIWDVETETENED